MQDIHSPNAHVPAGQMWFVDTPIVPGASTNPTSPSHSGNFSCMGGNTPFSFSGKYQHWPAIRRYSPAMRASRFDTLSYHRDGRTFVVMIIS